VEVRSGLVAEEQVIVRARSIWSTEEGECVTPTTNKRPLMRAPSKIMVIMVHNANCLCSSY
jgi:hypothetical protein